MQAPDESARQARLLARVDALMAPPARALWVGAPVGMGKSRLAALLMAGPGTQAWVLHDDLLRESDGDASGQRLAAAIEAAPAGTRLLLLSRRAPPAALARLQLQGLLRCLPAAELLFTAEEWPGAEAWGGWPAAAALPADPAEATALLQRLVQAEVLDGLAPCDRELLARRCWLDLAAGAAADATHLQTLAAAGVPLLPSPTGLRLAPWFAHVLRRGTGRSQWHAALEQLLGDSAAAPDAALALAREAAACGILAAWPAVAEQLLQAGPRWLAACRHRALAQACAELPPALCGGPLLALQAQALAAFDAKAGRDTAVRALRLLEPAQAELRHTLLVQVIAAHFQTFDSTEPLSHWLQQLPPSMTPADAPPALALAAYSALFLREPAHAALPAWEAAVQRLPASAPDPNQRLRAAMLLAKQGWYTARHAGVALLPGQARAALDDPRCTPYARLLWGLALQYRAWALADPASGLEVTHEALAQAAASGITSLDRHLRLHGACFAQLQGDGAAAQAQLALAEAGADAGRRMEAWHLFSVKAWLLLEAGQAVQALEAAQLALEAAEAMGPAPAAMSRFIAGQAAIAAGRGAEAHAQALADTAAACHNRRAAFAAAWLRATQASAARRPAQAELATALRHWGEGGGGLCFGLHHEQAATLLAQALEAGIEPTTAASLATAHRLEPPPDAGARWPWRVSLGGLAAGAPLEVSIDGAPLALGPKLPQRPLQLLEALVRSGGSAPAARLADRLWPEAEGDRAMDAFEVALRRLRALLVHPDALLLQGGVLSLNRRCVWLERSAAPGPVNAAHRPTAARLA